MTKKVWVINGTSGSGKTTKAIASAVKAAKMDMVVLFINDEELPERLKDVIVEEYGGPCDIYVTGTHPVYTSEESVNDTLDYFNEMFGYLPGVLVLDINAGIDLNRVRFDGAIVVTRLNKENMDSTDEE